MKTQTSSKHIAILGEKLERHRLLQNISQADLAGKAGISVRTLRRIESGQGGSMDSFIRLLMALDIDGNLAVLIPDSTVRPMERARQAKTERLRASSTGKSAKTSDAGKTGWVWGDEDNESS